jgi:hypothetical protein
VLLGAGESIASCSAGADSPNFSTPNLDPLPMVDPCPR